MRTILSFVAAVLFALHAQVASAYTECQVAPHSVHSGDAGIFYVFFTNGGSARIQHTDEDFKQTVAMIMTAIVTERTLVVRYAADNVPCTDNFVWMTGITIYK